MHAIWSALPEGNFTMLTDYNPAEMPVGVAQVAMPVGRGRPAVDAGLAHTGYCGVRKAYQDRAFL